MEAFSQPPRSSLPLSSTALAGSVERIPALHTSAYRCAVANAKTNKPADV
jgi:hypothetical protein